MGRYEVMQAGEVVLSTDDLKAARRALRELADSGGPGQIRDVAQCTASRRREDFVFHIAWKLVCDCEYTLQLPGYAGTPPQASCPKCGRQIRRAQIIEAPDRAARSDQNPTPFQGDEV